MAQRLFHGSAHHVTALDSVNIPFVQQFLDPFGAFQPNDMLGEAATTMLGELARLSGALSPLREPTASTAA